VARHQQIALSLGSHRQKYVIMKLYNHAEEVFMEVITPESSAHISRTLGETIIRMWSRLPHDVQHDLFEETVKSLGESMRPQLAIFLHDKHARTTASITDRATLKPDSRAWLMRGQVIAVRAAFKAGVKPSLTARQNPSRWMSRRRHKWIDAGQCPMPANKEAAFLSHIGSL
jgi:hypothetical protein